MSRNPPVWHDRKPGWIWISHMTLTPADAGRLRNVERLTVWNVRFPERFLAELRKLWWLDIRGGTASDLSVLDGCRTLRGLAVNQIRGLTNLDAVARLHRLEVLSLYGLARVEALPDLGALPKLRRVELGQMRALRVWAPLAAVSSLEELVFVNKLNPDDQVVAALAAHPRLRTFAWYAADEPVRKVRGVAARINRPQGRVQRAEDWFDDEPTNG